MGKLKEIAQGFLNLVLKKLGILKASTQTEAERRQSICDSCPLNVKGFCSTSKTGKVKEDFMYLGNKRKKDEVYAGCGCFLAAKTLSVGSTDCPLNYWS